MPNAGCPTRSWTRHGLLALLAFAVGHLALVPGCQPPRDRGPVGPPAALPSYVELAERYNANVVGLDRLWARASVRVVFRDQRGKWKTETGEDSLVMVEPPHRVAISVGKLGKTALWAGSDKDMYWLFDNLDARTVWYGRTENLGRPATRPLPLAVHPHRLVALLGVTPINPQAPTDAETVHWEDGQYRIDVPDQSLRLWLDPQTALPRRAALLDEAGRITVMAWLSGELRVEKAGVPDRANWPRIADRIEAKVMNEDATLTVWLRDATDGRGSDRIERAMAGAFHFGRLIQALNPQQAIDLDAQPVDGIGTP